MYRGDQNCTQAFRFPSFAQGRQQGAPSSLLGLGACAELPDKGGFLQ